MAAISGDADRDSGALPLREKVLKWIHEQGYPLEMKVASLFRKMPRIAVRQSWHYVDPESTKSREIDVVATLDEPLGYAAVHFAIECKAPKKPWVMFTSAHTEENYNRFLAFAIMSKDARNRLTGHFMAENALPDSVFNSLPWFGTGNVVGHALGQAFDGNSDVPYIAAVSAMKAALHCCAVSPQHNACPPLVVSFPVVVTSTPLYACHLDENGDMSLSEIEMGFYFFQQRLGSSKPTRVAIVTEVGLQRYIDDCIVVATKLLTTFEPEVKIRYEKMTAPQPPPS